jgi:hypothetical protein
VQESAFVAPDAVADCALHVASFQSKTIAEYPKLGLAPEYASDLAALPGECCATNDHGVVL